MTYSVVARDAQTGEIGVAVQTCNFAVGSIVPWARPAVGAVATQAFAEPAYGPRVLDALAAGATASNALAGARDVDPAAAMRQVGVVDAHGNVDAFTGELCIDHAGHHLGDGYAVQANMMASPAVWPAMAEAFEHATAPLANRMLSALHAAQRAGGDARGQMSAAMLVVDDAAKVIDIRVDDHPSPLDELARLLDIASAFRSFTRGSDALFAGRAEDALREIDAALAIIPDDENVRFLRAGALMFSGRTDDGQAVLRALVAARPSWATILRSFAAKGLLPAPAGLDVETFLPE